MAVTNNTKLDGTAANSGNQCTNFAVPFAAGTWICLTVDAGCKYRIRHSGLDGSGAASTNPVKIAYDITTEPDNTVFGGEDNTQWLTSSGVNSEIEPILGTKTIVLKAKTGAVLVQVNKIERLIAGTHQ